MNYESVDFKIIYKFFEPGTLFDFFWESFGVSQSSSKNILPLGAVYIAEKC
jgi:hypothetical protein